MGGGSDINEASNRLGLPVELLGDAADFQDCDTVYPDNILPVKIFGDMLTQWRIAPMGGPVGLDYNVLPIVLKIRKVDEKEEADIFECIKIMESAALKRMREVRK